MKNNDNDCRKCGATMRPVPQSDGTSPLDRCEFVVTGWRCVCGHWNNLKRRKKNKQTDA